MVTKEDIKDKLSTIGLDLDNLPEFLNKSEPIIFNPSRLNNDKELKVYKYISIKDIEIYCTPSHRDDPIKDKYHKSLPLGEYIKVAEEDSEKSAELLKAFDKISITRIKRIENEQRKMETKIPFTVHYNKSQLWQVYYSQDTGKYFMLVPLKEESFDEFFFLLKKKIELENTSKDEKIYIPISYVNYSEAILNNKQINDIENYLWVFTKNWALTYEVYDIENKMSLQIVGQTPIYDNIKSMYKVILHSEEQAMEFYKLLKALFILQTEIGQHYKFSTQVNKNNEIEFYYKDKKIEYNELPDFIKTEYIETEAEIKRCNQQVFELEDKLKKLKLESKNLDAEYFLKQKEISTYLECKKTFLGKVRYFFSKRKGRRLIQKESTENIENEKKDPKPIQGYTDDKKFHTINDLVTIQSLFEKTERFVKDLKQDVKALELKILNTKRKLKNATIYIKEIDEHKKSLFEFWRFANKDELLELETGGDSYTGEPLKINKKFDFEYDFEDLGILYDKMQRTKFSNQEMDNIYIATTNVLPIINMFKNGDMNKEEIEELLRSLKSEYFTTSGQGKTDFDIFGAMRDDNSTVKYLNNKSHRENRKDKFQLLNVNKKIDIFDFTEKLQTVSNSIKESMHKIKTNYDIPIYKVVSVNEKLDKVDYEVFDVNIETELNEYQNQFETAVKLIKINLKENYPIIYLTNCIYYDNTNNTLPVGMNVSSKVLIDADMFEYELVDKRKIKTNRYMQDGAKLYPKLLTIYIEEYDVSLKGKKETNI